MKKLFFLLLVLFSVNLSAQWGSAAVKLGYFNPSAAESGFMLGFEGGSFVDKYLSVNWSIDWYHKDYVDKKFVSDLNQYYGGTLGTLNELRAQTNIHDFPLMASLTARFPIAPRVDLYATGGVGAEVLFINFRDFQNPEQDEFETAFDFNWRVGFGASLITGPRSEVFGEIGYHYSMPSSTYEVESTGGLPPRTFERVYDMSGFMARLGFRFFY